MVRAQLAALAAAIALAGCSGVDEPPVAQPLVLQLREDEIVTGRVSAADPRGRGLTFAVVESSLGSLDLDPTSGTFTYRPVPDLDVADSFKFVAADGVLTSEPATVTLQVLPVNDPPLALDKALVVNEDEALTEVAAATDVDSPALTYAVEAAPVHGTLTLDAGTGAFTYRPARDYNGPDQFRFIASDGELTSNAATVSIEVLPVNDVPVVESQLAELLEGGTVTGRVHGTDVDGQMLVYAVVSGPSHGTLEFDAGAGAFTYRAGQDFSGTDQFWFVASDGETSSADAPLTIAAGPPGALAFATKPSSGTAGAPLADVAVRAVDVHGNTTDLPGEVALSLASAASMATLGSATVAAGSGTATFTGLTVQKAGSYVLRAMSGALLGESSAFTIGPAAASAQTSTLGGAAPYALADGATPMALVTTVKDVYGNPVPGADVTLTASGNATLVQSPPTDASGSTVGSIVSTEGGSQLVTANVNGHPIATAQVDFLAPVAIATSNGDTTVALGGTATFTVTAAGTPPFVFVWARNGAFIPGTYFWTRGNTATYSTPPLAEDDNGSSYAVTVYNQLSSVTSPAWTVNVVAPLPGQQVYTLFTDEPEIYPQRNSLTVRAMSRSAAGAGVTIGLGYTVDGLPTYDLTSSGAASVLADSANASLTLDFADPTSPNLQTGTLRLSPSPAGGAGTSPIISANYESPAWLAAHGRSGPPRLTITQMSVPMGSTQVEDWLIGEPTAADVSFAQATWGSAVSGLTSPLDIAQALGRSIIDQLEPHRGVPSDGMNTTPFQQYTRAVSGQDKVWCVNITAIFVWACRSFGVPARITGLGNVAYRGPSYNLETAEGHATAEVFDGNANRWVWMDPTMYHLGMLGPGGRLLGLVEAQRAVNDPDLLQSLTAVEHGPSAPDAEVPLLQSRTLRDVSHFLTRATIPAFTKASGLRLTRDCSSNEPDLFPRKQDLALAYVNALPTAYGARLQLVSSLEGLDHFEYAQTYTSDGPPDDGVRVSPDGILDVAFANGHSAAPRAQVYRVWAVAASGAQSTPYSVTVSFYSTEFYASFGQTSPGYVVFDGGGLPYATTAVEDWITIRPSPDDVAFAAATWGGAFDPAAGPVAKAQAIGAAILDRIGAAIGVPSDAMEGAAPFVQYRRAAAGVDQVDSRGLAAIQAYACNSLGIPARVVDMGRTVANGTDLVVEAAAPRSAVEIFDEALNRWVFIDLSLGVLGVEQAGVGLLNSAKLSRAAVEPTQTGTLTVVAYDPDARIERVSFAGTPAGGFLSGYFQLAPRLRFARIAP
jgi:hypothetical protein